MDSLYQTAFLDGAVDDSKPKEKTTAKMKINHGDCTTAWTFSSEKLAMQGVGVLFAKDGYKSTLEGALEAKYLKEAWKASGILSLATPDLGGGLKVNTQVSKISQTLISESYSVANLETNKAKKQTNYTHTLFYFCLARRRSRELGCQEESSTKEG